MLVCLCLKFELFHVAPASVLKGAPRLALAQPYCTIYLTFMPLHVSLKVIYAKAGKIHVMYPHCLEHYLATVSAQNFRRWTGISCEVLFFLSYILENINLIHWDSAQTSPLWLPWYLKTELIAFSFTLCYYFYDFIEIICLHSDFLHYTLCL